jgi:hypothetical protein
MNIFNSIKILIVPYASLILTIVYLMTGDIRYLFFVGAIFFIFSLIFFVIMLFTIIKFGFGSLIETEIEPVPWVVFFLSLMVYVYLSMSLIFEI